MSTQISLHDLTKSCGDRLLFDGVSLSIRPGERVGLVGENGAGKSTLLRLIAGTERPDEGRVVLRADGGVGHLAQTPDLPPHHTVQDAIDAVLADLRGMERRLRALERELGEATPGRLAEYGDLLTLFELRGGYEADARVEKALHALGLEGLGRERLLGSLSGGEQARLGLACLISAAPEVMLLDEPTNHLDAAALDWLEEALLAHRGTVLAVSHDRLFLQRIATSIVEVDADRRSIVRYGEGYGTFVAAKAASRRRWEQEYAQWCEQIAQLTDFADGAARGVAQGRAMKDNNKMAYDRDKGRVQASVSSRVRNAQERLRRLRESPVPRPPEPLRFTAAPDRGVTDGTLVQLDGVRVGDRLSVDSSPSPPANACWSTGPTARARPHFCGSWPGSPHRTAARSCAGAGSASLRRKYRSPVPPNPSWPPSARDWSATPRSSPPGCSPSGSFANRTSTYPSGRSRPASGAGSPWPGCWPAPPISCCSTNRPTTWRSASSKSSKPPWRPGPVHWLWSPTTGCCAAASVAAPTRYATGARLSSPGEARNTVHSADRPPSSTHWPAPGPGGRQSEEGRQGQ